MDITALSSAMTLGQVQTDVGVAMLSKNLDMIEVMGDSTVKMMEASCLPDVGQNIDIRL